MDTNKTLFDHFGGIAKMAKLLDIPPTTVASWRVAGRIPAAKQPLVLSKIIELDLPLDVKDIVFPLGPEESSYASGLR